MKLTEIGSHYDVVICGGGFAGQLVTRQLLLEKPELSILIVEHQPRPLPMAAHKVGESSVEGASYWFRHVLKLKDYLDEHHLPKLGLRFFGQGASASLLDRPELGARDFLFTPSVQIDRGLIENDLRALNERAGAHLLEDHRIHAVELAAGENPHRCVVVDRDGGSRGVECRWAIDATGWRRLFARTLKLNEKSGHTGGACWWRIEGEHDVSDFPRESPSWWSKRVLHRRWLSTNHVMGKGYWVWLIPLSTGHTSVGIVVDQSLHDISFFKSFERAIEWLREHEPELAAYLHDKRPVDFLSMAQFAHKTKQLASIDRWACVGTSAAFTDPLYSFGSDLIALSAMSTVTMIDLDGRGRLTPEIVAIYDRFYRSFVDCATAIYEKQFAVFSSSRVAFTKIVWDGMLYFGFLARVLTHEVPRDPARLAAHQSTFDEIAALNARVQQVLREWAIAQDGRHLKAGFYSPPHALPSCRALALGPWAWTEQREMDFALLQRQLSGTLRSIADAIAALAREDGASIEWQAQSSDPDEVARIRSELEAFLAEPFDIDAAPAPGFNDPVRVRGLDL
jgi:flavin-dependent dehydrogenase